MKHIRKIELDIDREYFEKIPAVQYDNNSRYLEVTLMSGVGPLDITGHTVIVSGYKPDGTEIFNSCKVVDAKKGIVEVHLSEQVSAVDGVVDANIQVYGGDKSLLSTQQFHIYVAKGFSNKNVQSSNEFSGLVDAISAVQSIDNRFSDTHAKIDLKRDKSAKLTKDDMDISKDSAKLGLNNLADEVHRALSGQAPSNPVIPNGSLVQEKYADRSVTSRKRSLLGTWGVLNFASAAINIDLENKKIIIPSGSIDVGGARFLITAQEVIIPPELISSFYLVYNANTLQFLIGGGTLFATGSVDENNILCGLFYNERSCMFNGARVLINGRAMEGHRAMECNHLFETPMLCNTIQDINKCIDIDVVNKKIKIPAGAYFLNHGGRLISITYAVDEEIVMDVTRAYGYLCVDTSTNKLRWLVPVNTSTKSSDIPPSCILIGWYQIRGSFYFLCDRYSVNGVRVDDFKISETIKAFEAVNSYVSHIQGVFSQHLDKLFVDYRDCFSGVTVPAGSYEPLIKGFTDVDLTNSQRGLTYEIDGVQNTIDLEYPLGRIDADNVDTYSGSSYNINLGLTTVNGTEPFTMTTNASYPDVVYTTFSHSISKPLCALKCNSFEFLPNNNWMEGKEGITKGNGSIGFVINKSRLSSVDIPGIKKFFADLNSAGTPVKFLYTRLTPEYKSASSKILITTTRSSVITKNYADILFMSQGIDVRAEIDKIKEEVEQLKTVGPNPNEFMKEEFINYSGISKNFAKFMEHWYNQDKDLTVVMVGDSIGARDMHTTYFTAAEQAKRPPVLVSKNFASAIFDKLTWGNVEYRRYDAASVFTELGQFDTITTKSEWDDSGDRPIHTRRSVSASCSVSYTIPSGAKRCNFIYRTELVGSETLKVAITGGKGLAQVLDLATDQWVEADGYVFSSKQVVGSGIGNTTAQKRLKMRCVSTSNNKVVTVTNTGSGSLCYWGIEYTNSDYMVTLINSHRGGHTVEMLSNYIVNDVIEYKPDLVIQQVPIMNMGCAFGEGKTPSEQVARFDNYFFNPNNSNSMYSLTNGLKDCEFIVWLPNLGYYSAGVDDSRRSLIKWATKGKLVDTLSYYKVFLTHLKKNGDIPTINLGELYLREAINYSKNSGKSLSSILKGSSPTGDSYTNDSLHPNDKGVAVMCKYFLPIFEDNCL